MTYSIRDNAQFNSKEIYFDEKPSEAVREALKDLSFRFHRLKKCWYGFAQENELIEALQNAEPATVVTDGYLGGGAVYGSKSNLSLYGADLAKEIRADIKAAGIKGVTIASPRGNIRATITLRPEDIKPFDEFYKDYEISCNARWIYFFDENGKTQSMYTDEYFTLSAEKQQKIKRLSAEFTYQKETKTELAINHYHIDDYAVFSASGIKKISDVVDIISAYRYDKSNSMVDYFDTNFYMDIYTKPAKAREGRSSSAA